MKRRGFRPFVLPLLLGLCVLLYYFGELVDWAAWDSLRRNFFYGVHDVHRLFFLAPIIYAAYYARVRGAIIITLVSLLIFLPRAFFISPYPDPLLRMLLFVIFAGAVGVLVGIVRNQAERAGGLENAVKEERDRALHLLDGLPDGIMVTGPDYRIRFVNEAMKRRFGEGAGVLCYDYLSGAAAPCGEECRLDAVIKERTPRRWVCPARDGRSYDVIAGPYVDADGSLCQIVSLRENAPGY